MRTRLRARRRIWRGAQRRPAVWEPARCFANRFWKSTTWPPSPFTDSGTAAPEVPEISEISARASRIRGARLSDSAYSRDARVRSSNFFLASSSSNASAFFALAFFFATPTTPPKTPKTNEKRLPRAPDPHQTPPAGACQTNTAGQHFSSPSRLKAGGYGAISLWALTVGEGGGGAPICVEIAPQIGRFHQSTSTEDGRDCRFGTFTRSPRD